MQTYTHLSADVRVWNLKSRDQVHTWESRYGGADSGWISQKALLLRQLSRKSWHTERRG